jgi:hypothetical protein
MRSSVARSAEKGLATNAYLCEVFRLSNPKESNRNRTWLSAEDARRSLREGRKKDDGAEFVRVVDRAVARIERLRGGAGVITNRAQKNRLRHAQPEIHASPHDALRKVPFDFAEAYGRREEARFTPYLRRQLNGMRGTAPLAVEPFGREVLQGEVLQFGSSREKKTKALGTGTNKR